MSMVLEYLPSKSLAPMGADEARIITQAIREQVDSIRRLLLEMFNREGWKVLGYASWQQYLENEFTNVSPSYLRRHTHVALIEAAIQEDGSLVGTHRESQLRPLVEILTDDMDAKVRAYHRAIAADFEPTAKDFRRAAIEVYIQDNGNDAIRERLRNGTISAEDAYKIDRTLNDVDNLDLYNVLVQCSDPELLPILKRLHKENTDTWQEISLSYTIPSYPEPIPLHRATANNLLAWLNEASAEHRAIARGDNKTKCERIATAARELISVLSLLIGDDGEITISQKIVASVLEARNTLGVIVDE